MQCQRGRLDHANSHLFVQQLASHGFGETLDGVLAARNRPIATEILDRPGRDQPESPRRRFAFRIRRNAASVPDKAQVGHVEYTRWNSSGFISTAGENTVSQRQ